MAALETEIKLRVIALLSGREDSSLNIFQNSRCTCDANQAIRQRIGRLLHVSVCMGQRAIEYTAQALDKPLFRTDITGSSENKDLDYEQSANFNQEDEVEQLYSLLERIRGEHGIEYEAVSVGAIASSYQKSRVESICKRLGISMLAYMWNQDQDSLLQQMIDNNFRAILIKVACMGLTEKHLASPGWSMSGACTRSVVKTFAEKEESTRL